MRVGKLAERQTDFEEVLTGPPVSAAFDASGQPTPAAAGFAKKNDVEVAALERLETPKGTYLAFRKQIRGKAAVDVLPDVLTGLLRELTFPKAMRWDASLDDGKGELAVRAADSLDAASSTAAGSCRSRSIARRSRRGRSSRRSDRARSPSAIGS